MKATQGICWNSICSLCAFQKCRKLAFSVSHYDYVLWRAFSIAMPVSTEQEKQDSLVLMLCIYTRSF